jgi:phospholipase C
VSWEWYSGGRSGAGITREYCPVCDPLIFSNAIMIGPLKKNLQDHETPFHDIDNSDGMPEVAFVIPPNSESAHPASSTVSRYEQFLRRLIGKVQGNRALWEKTAVLITIDESGGYWDSGYIQILDAFGDGTRIPLIAVSPFAKRGGVDHTYTDHVSILKFIEANWRLDPLSTRSRDHLPNPIRRSVRPLCPSQPARDRRSDEPLRVLSSDAEGVQQHPRAAGRWRRDRGDRSVRDCISYARSHYRDVAIEGDLGTHTNFDGGFP